MLEKLRPDIFTDSLHEISAEILKKKGIKGIIIDLDNTMTNWNERFITEDVCNWVKMMESQGLRFCVLSNSGKRRIEETVKKLGLSYVANAFKPRKQGFVLAMKKLKTEPVNTAVIGDQLFTDILGGKRLGMTTILIKPRATREFFGTKLMRKLEKIILKRF
ncbi:MAG: YqeG family HAD IIIA-type phosphatase [Clostridia bacterium]|nr:YqeG family HAD IIIA-type phosphatase [Clostridia bacterium]